jgi:hypothetical protein
VGIRVGKPDAVRVWFGGAGELTLPNAVDDKVLIGIGGTGEDVLAGKIDEGNKPVGGEDALFESPVAFTEAGGTGGPKLVAVMLGDEFLLAERLVSGSVADEPNLVETGNLNGELRAPDISGDAIEF